MAQFYEEDEMLFEADGIKVYTTYDGKLIEEDNASRYEFEDTPENRAEVIADAKQTIKEWER